MDIISLQEAKKVKKNLGKIDDLTTVAKDNAVVAINELNYLLGLLIPDAPPNLSTKTLVLNGTDCLISSNIPNNSTGALPGVGSSIKATRSLLPESVLLTGFGSGNTGSLSVELNGVETGSRDLVTSSDVGTFGELVITRNQDFPSNTPGFWEDMDAKYKAVSNISTGYNTIQMRHSISGNTKVEGFVIDNNPGNPTVSNVSVSEKDGSVNYSYSSGIKHYGTGSILIVTADLDNVITYVYGSVLAQILCGGLTTLSLSTTSLSVDTPVDGMLINLNREVTLNQNYFGSSTLQIKGLHPLSPTTTVNFYKTVLVRIGQTLEGIGAGKRVTTGTGDYPAITHTDFVSSSPVQAHETTIVGGILKHDKTNYSVNYLPVGEDYSTHDNSQYACFEFTLSGKNNATINVSGGGTYYDKCWIKLPGLTNGWLDTTGNYPGSGTPTNDGDPCRDGGGTSKTSFHVTFGANNTSGSNNKVLIRFKMSAGQSITNVTIT